MTRHRKPIACAVHYGIRAAMLLWWGTVLGALIAVVGTFLALAFLDSEIQGAFIVAVCALVFGVPVLLVTAVLLGAGFGYLSDAYDRLRYWAKENC